MNIEFYNCPPPGKIADIALPEAPEFVTYKPDFKLLQKYKEEFKAYKNILIIGNGGSINSFLGFYNALKHQATKEAYFLNSQDPDYIFELKQRLKPEETLVLSISKSGENTQQLEETMQFVEYPVAIVTGETSPLRAVAEKLGLKVITHPPIGGRYTGLTEVNLLAASIVGLDVEGLFKGGSTFYESYAKDNLAFKAASVFWQLEQKGFVDVLMFFYSHALYPMSYPIIQLCHESFGKGGKGQSYFAHEGPEVQHHTTQRFYGGIKNICGIFFTAENFLHPTQNVFPEKVHSVQIKGRHLADLSKIPLEKALEYEWMANIEDSRIQGIPIAHISMVNFSGEEIGKLIAFWQLYAVYASVLRGVDPFDQPQVESSKNISFNKRLAYKGIL